MFNKIMLDVSHLFPLQALLCVFSVQTNIIQVLTPSVATYMSSCCEIMSVVQWETARI